MRPKEFDKALLAAIPRLKSQAKMLTHNAELALDLVQDTVLRAMECHSSFAIGSNMSGWLYIIMRNKFLSDVRRAGRMIGDPDNLIASSITVDGGQIQAIQLADVLADLNGMSVRRNAFLRSVAIEGRSYDETAAIHSVKVGTVKSSVSRARQILTENGHA